MYSRVVFFYPDDSLFWMVYTEHPHLKQIVNIFEGLACCDSWDRKESDTTEWLNLTESSTQHVSSLSGHMIPNCFCLIASSDSVLTIFLVSSVRPTSFSERSKENHMWCWLTLSPSYFSTEPSSATQSCTEQTWSLFFERAECLG